MWSCTVLDFIQAFCCPDCPIPSTYICWSSVHPAGPSASATSSRKSPWMGAVLPAALILPSSSITGLARLTAYQRCTGVLGTGHVWCVRGARERPGVHLVICSGEKLIPTLHCAFLQQVCTRHCAADKMGKETKLLPLQVSRWREGNSLGDRHPLESTDCQGGGGGCPDSSEGLPEGNGEGPWRWS